MKTILVNVVMFTLAMLIHDIGARPVWFGKSHNYDRG